MTVDDVCDYLALSRDFVYDQVKLGRLRASRMARQLRFRRCDVDAFVDLHMLTADGAESAGTLPARGRRRRASVWTVVE